MMILYLGHGKIRSLLLLLKKHVRGFYAAVSNFDSIDLNIRVCFSAAGNAALSQRSKIRD